MPAAHDIPLEMHIAFEANVRNPWQGAVLGSKASGEPPMALGSSCVFALRDAVRAVRAEVGLGPLGPDLELPLTVERVWRECGVSSARLGARGISSRIALHGQGAALGSRRSCASPLARPGVGDGF